MTARSGPLALSWRRVVLALCGIGLAGAIIALVAADLLPRWWWSEALQHPRPQVAAGSLLCAAIAILLVRWRWRWCALLIPAWAIAGMVATLPAADPGAGRRIATLVTANVLSSNPDPSAAVARLLALDADVLILLETDHAWRRPLHDLRAAYPVHREILRDDNFGICVYARRGVIAVWQPDGVEVPCLVLALDGIEVLAAHPLPPFSPEYHAAWRAQLSVMAAWAAERPHAVIAGDLNATPWSSAFRGLLADGRLRSAGVASWTPTWLRGTPLCAPIDHVLAGPRIGLGDHAVGPEIGSDHQPVRVTIRLDG